MDKMIWKISNISPYIDEIKTLFRQNANHKHANNYLINPLFEYTLFARMGWDEGRLVYYSAAIQRPEYGDSIRIMSRHTRCRKYNFGGYKKDLQRGLETLDEMTKVAYQNYGFDDIWMSREESSNLLKYFTENSKYFWILQKEKLHYGGEQYVIRKKKDAFIIGGIHRSGTTWLFNIFKNIFSDYDSTFAGRNNSYEYDKSIVKSHLYYNEFNLYHKIFIVRDLRSVAASVMKFRPMREWLNVSENNMINVLDNFIKKEYEPWKKDLILRYEDGKQINVNKIKNYTRLNFNIKQIIESVESIKIPEQWDKENTELHPGHITYSSKNDLSDKLYNEITIKFKYWLEKYGYDITLK